MSAIAMSNVGDLFRDILVEYGGLTRVQLCRYLAPREPARQLYNLVAEYPRRGGRMLRPSLCIAAARAFGASTTEALTAATALELLHNGFLVHDDIEDESDSRRGLPTLHSICGVPAAINAGDALTILGLRALIDSREQLGAALAIQLLEEAERMARDCVEGQAIELGWRADNALVLSDADYLEMVLKKTCSYTTIFPLRVGALIGRRGRFDLDRLLRFGFFLGAAFQVQDDILNLEGDELQYGKELDGDLWEGKRTLMLIHTLREVTPEERSRIGRFLGLPRNQRSRAEVVWIRGLMERSSSLERARRVAHGLAGAAEHEAQAILADLPPSRDRDFLAAASRWVLTRC
jgi:geranylgeranyl diphosphate synthase type II